jgi:hypothetical protein
MSRKTMHRSLHTVGTLLSVGQYILKTVKPLAK